MKIKIKIQDITTKETWWEETLVDGDDPLKEAKKIVKRFNDSLRPNESRRKLLHVECLDSRINEHDWQKRNLVTEQKNGQFFDRYSCERCGITAKRYGISRDLVRDKRYKSAKYDLCKGRK